MGLGHFCVSMVGICSPSEHRSVVVEEGFFKVSSRSIARNEPANHNCKDAQPIINAKGPESSWFSQTARFHGIPRRP